MKGMMKWPLIIAAVLVSLRIVTEQMGMPDTVNNLISVMTFCVVIAPIYFALRIAKSNDPRPYSRLLKTNALFTLLVRGVMVIPTYWLAYIYQWQAPRFSLALGGVVGATPIMAVLIPFGALLLWVFASVVVGGGLGSLIIANSRHKTEKATA